MTPFASAMLARERAQGEDVRLRAVLQALAHRHRLADEARVDTRADLHLHVRKRAVDEAVGLARGQAVVDEPRHRHRDGEGEDDAQRELEVQAAARGHFAFPSAMTAFAAASTSGRRRLTATP